MIGTIRKHQKWLWLIIITLTIISFVWFFSPNARWKGIFSGSQNVALINGRPVTIDGKPIPIEEFNQVYRENFLAAFMRTGGREWPGSDENTKRELERDTVFRLFMIRKLHELGIHVSEQAVIQAARERLSTPTGTLPAETFQREYLYPKGLTLDDFDLYLQHELGIQQLVNVAAVSAKLYNPKEAEAIFRKQHESKDTRLAVFWASNYLDKVMVSQPALTNYYKANEANYRVPNRVVVNYVEFPATNYFAEADKKIENNTNFNSMVNNAYLKRGTNYYKGTNALSEADAKKQIKEEIRHMYALLEARRKAIDFGTALVNLPQPDQAKNLQTEAAKLKLPVKTSPPLEQFGAENEDQFPKEFREQAFKLNSANPIAFNPIVGENAVYVMALNKTIPSEIQPLDAVKDKVIADYKHSQALFLAKNAALAFRLTLTNGLAQKQTFEQIAAAAKVTTVQPEPFSNATTSLTNLDERLDLDSLQNAAERLKPGGVSQYMPVGSGKSSSTRYLSPADEQGGFVMYLKQLIPVDDATVKKDLPDYLARLRIIRQNEAFNQWFRRQAEQAKIFIPPPSSSGGG